MSEREPWQILLRDALAVLASPPDEQVTANGPGCLACDLVEDFYHAHALALQGAPRLSDAQRTLLGRIEGALRALRGPDVECGDPGVVRRPAWQALRALAAEVLAEFGWQGDRAPPFVEVSPGVWKRPHAGPSEP